LVEEGEWAGEGVFFLGCGGLFWGGVYGGGVGVGGGGGGFLGGGQRGFFFGGGFLLTVRKKRSLPSFPDRDSFGKKGVFLGPSQETDVGFEGGGGGKGGGVSAWW